MKIALVIGRFQIVGNQHVDLFKQIEENFDSGDFKKLCIAIATPGKKDSNNPFPPEGCLEMIKPIASETADKIKTELCFKIVPDINNPVRYNVYVAEAFGFDLGKDKVIVFSENPWTISCFEKRKGYEVFVVNERVKIRSTLLRRLWVEKKDLSPYVPKSTLEYLEKNKKD